MVQWRCVAKIDDCPPGHAIEAVAGDRVIAIYNVEGDFFALDGVCPHQGGPLGQGALCGRIVTCPWHGWQFDVSDGTTQVSHTIRQAGVSLKVAGEDILVALDSSP